MVLPDCVSVVVSFAFLLITLGQEGHNQTSSYNYKSCVCLLARVFFGCVVVIVFRVLVDCVWGSALGVFPENRDGRQRSAEGSIA